MFINYNVQIKDICLKVFFLFVFVFIYRIEEVFARYINLPDHDRGG
jgi:hypothetical protein